jgi:hypothetical protein
MDKDEEFEARTAAAGEVGARLRARGIAVAGAETPEALRAYIGRIDAATAGLKHHPRKRD